MVQFWEAVQLVFGSQFQGQDRVTQMSQSIKAGGASVPLKAVPRGRV